MYKFTRPEDSAEALASMLSDGEHLLQTLGIPYRILQICTGDLGFGSTITYDLEVWAAGPAANGWRLARSAISEASRPDARASGSGAKPEARPNSSIR